MVRVSFVLTLVVALIALVKSTMDRRGPTGVPLLGLVSDRFPPPSVRLVGAMLLGAAAGAVVSLLPWAVLALLGLAAVRLSPEATWAVALLTLLNAALQVAYAAGYELVYRGAVLPQLAYQARAGIALGLAAIIFAAGHPGRELGQPPSALTLAVLAVDGLGYGLAFYATRSLWVPAAAHAARSSAVRLLADQGAAPFEGGLLTFEYSVPEFWVGAPAQAGLGELVAGLIVVALAALMLRARIRRGAEWLVEELGRRPAPEV